MGACGRVTVTPFWGRENLPGEKKCQGKPHSWLGVEERSGDGCIPCSGDNVCKELRERAQVPGPEMCLWAQRTRKMAGAAESGRAGT